MARTFAVLSLICWLFSLQLGVTSAQTSGEPPPAGAKQTETAPSEAPPAAEGEDLTAPEGGMPPADEPDDMSLGEIPTIVTVELTADMARRAIGLFALVRDKYAEANLEDFENLQDFVDQTEQGKQLDADVKAAGFSDVNSWNTAITTVGFAYEAITDDQTADIKLQIEDVKNDTTLAQDLKDKMIASLNAMIPSDNNKKIVQELMDDPAYADKLRLLGSEAE